MNNNPIAKIIRNAFIKNVTERPLVSDKPELGANTIGNILRNKRITRFEQAVNKFLTDCGERPIPATGRFINEKDLLTFSLLISGYIRDAQKELDTLKTEHACDPDLIKLYQAAAKYSVECNDNVEGSKYIFREHCDYQFWKIHNTDTLSNAKFNNHGFIVNPKRHNLILSMPFHIQGTQEELQKWTSKFMAASLDDKSVFGSQVDVYLAHFPIEQPRGEKFALSLSTIRSPETFFTTEDMRFVRKNMTRFLGKDITVDDKNNITAGTPYTNDEFIENCRNLTIVGYCAGTAHAHRWLNAFSHLASQIYPEQTAKQAMQNIFVVSYAFLPIQKELPYSGIHFMSNYADDHMRKEPFIKMFNPELYEKVKYHASEYPAHVTALPDGRNHIVSFDLPEQVTVKTADGRIEPLADVENGHHMGLVTLSNTSTSYAYPTIQFKNILHNACLGKRGADVFRQPVQQQQHAVVLPFYFQKHLAMRK